jgi:dipeptidyl aminopeptidase/acylaminoacyl peptidase
MGNIKIDDFTRFKFLSSPQFDLYGENLCYVVHEADIERNTYNSNLWIYNSDTKEKFQLTALNNEKSFTWMNDGRHIIFSTIRKSEDMEKRESGDEFSQFYKIKINGGEAREYFRISRNVNSIKQVDDNTFIFTSTYNSSKKQLDELSEEEKGEELKRRKEEKDYQVIDEIPFWSNGKGFTNKNRNRLYIYHVDTETYEPITDEHTDVAGFNLNEDKNKLVFTTFTYKDKMELNNDILLYDLKENKLDKINSSEQFIYEYVNFIGDNKLICTGSDMKKYGENENHKFYIIDLEDKKRTLITPDFDCSLWNSVGSDCRYVGSATMMMDKEYLYFITTEGDSSHLNRVNSEGKIEKVISTCGSVDGYAVKNGKLVFIGLRESKLQELYELKNGKEIQITNFNEWVQREKKIASLESISVETAPRVIIDGWVMKPVDFDPNKKYPAILDIHGGPKTVYGQVFFHEMQYWASEGYVVFFCNPRGSNGRDDAFSDIRGQYGFVDYDDIMKFTDAVLEKYSCIDTERVGVTGGSYGGFMTNWIIGHTDRFKAAASQRSISNWISKFCTTDIGYYFVDDQQGGTPWNNHHKLWEHSPLKYADRVKTPTLFIHSEEDYRCWLAEGLQMFTALKYHNVDARLCMFKGENHELSRGGKPKHRIRRLKEITHWFDKYLK